MIVEVPTVLTRIDAQLKAPDRCPTCGSIDPNVAASNCGDPNYWHRGAVSDEDYRDELRAREELRAPSGRDHDELDRDISLAVASSMNDLDTNETRPLTSDQIADVLVMFFHALVKMYPREREHLDAVLTGFASFLAGEPDLPKMPASTTWWVSIFAGFVGGLEGWCGKPEVIVAIEWLRKNLADKLQPKAQA